MEQEQYYRFDLRLRSNYQTVIKTSKSLKEVWDFLQDHDVVDDMQVYQYYCESQTMQDQVAGTFLKSLKVAPKSLYQIPENFYVGWDGF